MTIEQANPHDGEYAAQDWPRSQKKMNMDIQDEQDDSEIRKS
jgi:hypothetical protein